MKVLVTANINYFKTISKEFEVPDFKDLDEVIIDPKELEQLQNELQDSTLQGGDEAVNITEV